MSVCGRFCLKCKNLSTISMAFRDSWNLVPIIFQNALLEQGMVTWLAMKGPRRHCGNILTVYDRALSFLEMAPHRFHSTESVTGCKMVYTYLRSILVSCSTTKGHWLTQQVTHKTVTWGVTAVWRSVTNSGLDDNLYLIPRMRWSSSLRENLDSSLKIIFL